MSTKKKEVEGDVNGAAEMQAAAEAKAELEAGKAKKAAAAAALLKEDEGPLRRAGTWYIAEKKNKLALLSTYPMYVLGVRPGEYEKKENTKGKLETRTIERAISVEFHQHLAWLDREYMREVIEKPYYGGDFIFVLELRAAIPRRIPIKGFSVEIGRKQALGFVSQLCNRSAIQRHGLKLEVPDVIGELSDPLSAEEKKILAEIHACKRSWNEAAMTGSSMVLGR